MSRTVTTLAALAVGAAPEVAAPESGNGRATIVLVHGAFVDGSGWAGVHRILRDEGFNASESE